jgi:hypothetical protein
VLFTALLALPDAAEAQLGLSSDERRCSALVRRLRSPRLVPHALVLSASLGDPASSAAEVPDAAAAEDAHEPDSHASHVPHIPEPMVFDLVRGLGARQWELEANTLFRMPIDPDNVHLEWAPEIEVALFDGFALELELPMRDENVEALKAAAQLTFGTAADGRFIHGTQLIVEYDLHREATQTSLLYIAGVELDSTWSILGMAGARTTFDAHRLDLEVLINANLFARVAEPVVLGVEVNYASELGRDPRLLLMPQAHIALGRHLRWQLGIGLSATADQRGAVASSRLIVEL